MSRHRSSSKGVSGGSGGSCSRSSPRVEIAEIPEFNNQQQQSNRMTQKMQSRNQRRKNLALSCTVLCAVGAATTLFPDGLVDIGGPFARLVSGRKLRASKQRRLQLAAADYSALLAANAPPAVPAMGAPAMGAAPVAAGTTGAGGELSDADIAKFLAKYDLELKDLELLQKLREGYVKADGTSTSSTNTGAPPVPEPPATPATPPVDYAAMLGTPATPPAAATSSVSAPEAAAPAAPATTTTTTTSTSTPLAVPLGPIEDCSVEADNWLQNFCELRNYKNKFGDCNVPDKWDENRILSNWVKKQREQYDLLMAGQDNQMNSDRKDKLDEIGFDFTGTGTDAASGVSVSTSTSAVAAAPTATDLGTATTMPGAPPPAIPGIPLAAPAAPAVPTDPTQMTFEQQMAAMQALSF